MIELVDNPRTNTRTLARLIANDQALTAKILKLANSAYYGFSREISTVDMAIVVMGFNAVKEMGLSLSIFDTFKNSTSIDYFDINKYWEHSVAAAIVARYIAKSNGLADSGELFVAGLLHDIGKMVLIQYFSEEFQKISRFSQEKEIDFYRAEQEILGIDHGEIGALIAEKWHLPTRIVSWIRNHHKPKSVDNPFKVDIAVVNLADLVCHRVRMSNDGHRRSHTVNPEITSLIDATKSFDESMLLEIEEELFLELDRSELLFTMME